jgi:predicted glycoside hydrolase/deacetylase ChbG (UPF0249 family)
VARLLIVNADDLGRSPGVDRGIVRAHREGIVTSATLMANSPDAPHAGALARETPSLDVGVHLVLTFARPVSEPRRVPSLVTPRGEFPRPSALAEMDLAREEALVEYRAQYARAKELIGREPTHLDSHHWVHDLPALEWALGELARETGAAARIHDDGQRDRYRARGVRTPDRFCRDFQHAGHIDIATLTGILGRLEDGVTELMCHPAEPDAELLRGSTYARERAEELATLTDPLVRRALDEHGVTLTTFAALA